jgi:type VI secretion system protein
MRTRLLERIALLETPSKTGVIVSHETALKRSIKNYLLRLLNTRRGDPAIDPYYGMPDMANIAGTLKAESNEQLEEDIVEQIRLYEKRFTEPAITLLVDRSDVIAFHYELRGMINVGLSEVVMRPFILDLTLNAGGRISLEEKRGF